MKPLIGLCLLAAILLAGCPAQNAADPYKDLMVVKLEKVSVEKDTVHLQFDKSSGVFDAPLTRIDNESALLPGAIYTIRYLNVYPPAGSKAEPYTIYRFVYRPQGLNVEDTQGAPKQMGESK